jgi:hypothetical protein
MNAPNKPFLSVRFANSATAALGREDSLVTGSFREAESHWPLFGYEFEERTDASRPIAVIRHFHC